MYETLARGFARRTFQFWQALGLHLTPNHYSQPIPDTTSLPASTWSRHSELVGIDLNEVGQLDLLRRFVDRYCDDYTRFPRNRPAQTGEYFLNNDQFLGVDAEILYCMVRDLAPRRMIEVGSGYSTSLAAAAIRATVAANQAYRCDLLAIDPHPRRFLQDLAEVTEWIPQPVQNVPLARFEALGAGDILFIDSSHVLRIGSDVQYEILEILPRLAIGVFVHFHDIFLPAEYPRDWVMRNAWFYNEQYLLQAFLTLNDTFEVVWASSFLHLNHPGQLAAAFPSYKSDGHWGTRVWSPSSFWLRRVR